MTRRVFYSFHFKPDNWRVSKVRNIGALAGNKPATDNDWHAITKKGAAAIKEWIDDQLHGRGCTIVLIGEATAGRKWIDYEIEKSWNDGKGLLGIHIHNLTNSQGEKSSKGANPFSSFELCEGKKKLSGVVKCYDPPYTNSSNVYNHIADNVEKWIDDAVDARKNFKC